jgi:hypothetical protein
MFAPVQNVILSIDDHIPLATLWTYRANTAALKKDQSEHLMECDSCMSLLGLCHIAKSLEHAARLAEESGQQFRRAA